MLQGERLLKLHQLGFDITKNYDELVDQLIENYEAEKEANRINQKDLFSQTLYSINTIRKN